MLLGVPDKLVLKDTFVAFYLSYIISTFNGEKTAKQRKADAVLLELADVANAL